MIGRLTCPDDQDIETREVDPVSTPRCEWCARFVKVGTAPVRRQCRGADHIWRVFTQVLCPQCRPDLPNKSSWSKVLG